MTNSLKQLIVQRKKRRMTCVENDTEEYDAIITSATAQSAIINVFRIINIWIHFDKNKKYSICSGCCYQWTFEAFDFFSRSYQHLICAIYNLWFLFIFIILKFSRTNLLLLILFFYFKRNTFFWVELWPNHKLFSWSDTREYYQSDHK